MRDALDYNNNDVGLNWRATDEPSHQDSHASASSRPRTVVRAKPLSQSNPQLKKILMDYSRNSNASMRSLAANRDGVNPGGGVHTLTYDELSMLFRR